MARYEKKPEHKFSRVKNHLAELQKWWPVYIKDDTTLGISIDPVLFRSQFSSYQSDNDIVDEATTAGIRVEAINPDGTDITGTEPTIVISGSGTYNPRCRINHSDGTFSEVLLIAPTLEAMSFDSPNDQTQANNADDSHYVNSLGTLTGYGGGIPALGGAGAGESWDDIPKFTKHGFCKTTGPYPVFMTIQELVEYIDSYRHIGLTNDSEKRAFLPYGLGTVARNPITNLDPRISGESAFPTAETYRATVFMPMLLDSNQLSKSISNAQNAIVNSYMTCKNGTTRYNQNPLEKHADLEYKKYGESGDFKLDLDIRRTLPDARTTDEAGGVLYEGGGSVLPTAFMAGSYVPMSMFHMDKSSSYFGNPSYRMSMALACFLKDGTYSLNNGTMIPYSYDNRRYIGGTMTSSLYAVWDGSRGYGDSESGGGHDASYDKFRDGTPAGIYPYFDFVQGPLSPQAQGTNWNFNAVRNANRPTQRVAGIITNDMDMTAPTRPTSLASGNFYDDGYKGSLGLGEITPNPRPSKVVAVEYNGPLGEMSYWVFAGNPNTVGAPTDENKMHHNPIPVGVPIFTQFIDLSASGIGEFSSNNGITSGRLKNTAIHSLETGRITYERFMIHDEVNTGIAPTDTGAQPFLFNGWNLHRRLEIHGGGAIGGYDPATGVWDGKPYWTQPSNTDITPDSIVAGCAAEHFGGDNTARTFIKYVVHIAPHMRRDAELTVKLGAFTLLTPLGSQLTMGRNYNKLWAERVRYCITDTSAPYNELADTEELVWYDNFPQTESDAINYTINFNPFGHTGDYVLDSDSSFAMIGYQTMAGLMNIGWSVGMGYIDSNVPAGSSLEDTLGGRPKFGGLEHPNKEGVYEGLGVVPRSIQIETIGSNNNTNINNAPMISGKGQGSLRIPAPLGHDLSQRYNTIGLSGKANNALTPTNSQPLEWTSMTGIGVPSGSNFWIPRGDLMSHYSHMIPNKWAFRGISSPLWSYMDSATGSHAWDYIKPKQHGTGSLWDFGRNRPFPAHEREGTRLAMSPALNNYSVGFTTGEGTVHHVPPNQETNLIGLSETGCSPIHLDMEMTVYVPELDNRLFIIEFDQNENDALFGRHAWIGDTATRDAGWGFHPLADNATRNAVYRPVPYVDKDKVVNDDGTFIPATQTNDDFSEGFLTPPAGSATNNIIQSRLDFGNHASYGGIGTLASRGYPYPLYTLPNRDARLVGTGTPNPPAFDGVFERTAVWFMSANTHYTASNYIGGKPFALGGKAGVGRISGGSYGTPADYTEGTQVIRATFTETEMIFTLNGNEVTRNVNNNGEVWGVSIKNANLFTFVNRDPFIVEPILSETQATMGINNPYEQIRGQEPAGFGRANSAQAVFQETGGSVATTFFGYAKRWSFGGTGGLMNEDLYLPRTMPEHYSNMLNDKTIPITYSTPALSQSCKDVQIDEIIFRHLPTPAMLPFTVDTTVMSQPSGVAIAKYNSLQIHAENIDTSKKRNITISLFEPPTLPTDCQIAREATTPIDGFQDLDPFFVADIGNIDLSDLPTTHITNGFVIRFNFYMPSTEDSSLHPVNYRQLPTITKWELLYDHKPTTDVAVIGNTYNGQTATTVGAGGTPQSITTKVGHIVSVTGYGTTIDPDRKITEIKINFGDGTDSGFVPVETALSSVTLEMSHVYSSSPVAPATYFLLTAQAKDDNGNISDISTPDLRIGVDGTEPVGILRAIPSLVRAGQSIRFDGSQSYTLNNETTLTGYTFVFGDGSTTVGGAQTYQDHTFAIAGEYQATLVVTDSDGGTSPIASQVVKVLPATTIVPLRLQTQPASFRRTRRASLSQTAVLDSIYPEISDTGQRADEFTLSGSFLKDTQNRDIQYMEELLLSGSLVEIEWQTVNFEGVPDSKTFIGRITSFDYNRQGGSIDQTPYTATFIRESGLGA